MASTISSEEVNYLVLRYLQESGFAHSAFVFGYESGAARSIVEGSQIPSGALLGFLQRGLSYVEIETAAADVLQSSAVSSTADEAGSLADVHRAFFSADRTAREPVMAEQHNPMPAQDPTPTLALTDADALVLAGHASEVFTCSWNPRYSLLATGSGDKTARIWAIPNSLVAVKATPPLVLMHNTADQDTKEHDVTSVDWKPDGSFLASGSYDGIVRIWSQEGRLLHELRAHKGPLFTVKWNPRGDLLASAGVDKVVRIWNALEGKVERELSGHSAPTLDIDWKDDHVLASCSTDKAVCIYDLGNRDNPMCPLREHKDEVNTVRWDPSGTLLASGSDDFTAKIWSFAEKQCLVTLGEHTKEVYLVRWCPDTSKALILATASFDTTVRLWNAVNGACLLLFALHKEPVYSIAFSPSGKFLASGCFDQFVHVFRVEDALLVRSYHGESGIFEINWNPEGNRLAVVFSNGNVTVIDPRGSNP